MSIWVEYQALVLSRIERETQAIISGSPQTLEDYRHRCGVIRGLKESLAMFEEVVKSTPQEERY